MREIKQVEEIISALGLSLFIVDDQRDLDGVPRDQWLGVYNKFYGTIKLSMFNLLKEAEHLPKRGVAELRVFVLLHEIAHALGDKTRTRAILPTHEELIAEHTAREIARMMGFELHRFTRAFTNGYIKRALDNNPGLLQFQCDDAIQKRLEYLFDMLAGCGSSQGNPGSVTVMVEQILLQKWRCVARLSGPESLEQCQEHQHRFRARQHG